MADTKITALAAIATVDPAADVLPIVDISDTSMAASGTTKKVTSNQILGAGGTATLASATITGAATVGTTLGVTGASTLASVGVTGAATVGTTLGVTGVSTFAAGTALLPALTTTGDTNTGIYYPAADTFAVTTGGTERYRVDSSGNVGIGVTPSSWGSNSKALQVGGGGAAVSSTGAGTSSSRFTHGCYFDNTNWKYQYTSVGATLYEVTGANSGSTHAWYIAPGGTAGNTVTAFTAAAMTLDASGNLLVGTTSAGSNSGIGLKVAYSATAPYFSTVGSSTSASEYSYLLYSTGGTPAFKFYVSYSGQISATSGTVAALSDARFKENIQDIDVGLSAILALKPRKFDWKAGRGKDIKGDRGFIAQEFETVFPNLIDEWADPAPEGEAPYKSVRQDLIPVLVKAIQELTARVQTLEAK